MKQLICCLMLVCLSVRPSLAQKVWVNPYTGGTWNNPGSCLLETMIRNRMNRQMLEKSITRPVPARQAAPARVTYRASDSLANAAQLAASLTDDPKDRNNLEQFFREALTNYRAAARKDGRPNDVGHALALCIAVSYGVATDRDVPESAVPAITRQMDEALLAMPGLREAGDEQKQSVAETFAMVGMFLAAGYDQSVREHKTEARAAYKQLAEASFRALTGVDPGELKLTAAGLTKR